MLTVSGESRVFLRERQYVARTIYEQKRTSIQSIHMLLPQQERVRFCPGFSDLISYSVDEDISRAQVAHASVDAMRGNTFYNNSVDFIRMTHSKT